MAYNAAMVDNAIGISRAGGRFTFMCRFGLALLLLAPRSASADLEGAWALGESTKVKAGDTSHALRAGNTHFENGTIKLFGMKNEVLGFQVILVGGSSDTKNVQLRLASIGPIKNGASLSDEPDKYFLDRNIEVFEQRYLPLTRSSFMNIPPQNNPMRPDPKYWKGELPDPLLTHRKPLEVRAGKNQGFWIDVYVPKNAPAGIHKGTVEILIDGKPCAKKFCKLPIELDVLDKTMPDRSTARAIAYFSGSDGDRDSMAARYFKDVWDIPDAKMHALRRRHFHLGRRHRITFFVSNHDKPTPQLTERLSGKAFTREAGYYGPGMGVGQDFYAIYAYGKKDLSEAQAQTWKKYLEQFKPTPTYLYYTLDEPGDNKEALAKVNRRGKAVKSVPTFVTTHYRPEIDVDIFCSPPMAFTAELAKKARAAGKQFWIYNGMRPYSGTPFTDDVGPAWRVNSWIQYKFDIPFWFYWEMTYYKDFQGGRGYRDLWKDPLTFTNKHGDRWLGDGVMVYAGRDVKYPKSDHGIERPLPSYRLKAWRRGIQDVEYLAMLKKAGHKAFVKKLLETMVPYSVEDKVQDSDVVSWPEDGERWARVHKLMFDALKSGKPPTIDKKQLAQPKDPFIKRAKRWVKKVLSPFIRSRKRKMVSLAAGGFLFLVFIGLIVLIVRRRRRKRQERGDKR
jgi:hypothetical protein